MSRPRLAAALLATTAILPGCAARSELASQVARADVDGAELLRRDGTLALALCQDEAAYAYLEMLLGIGREGAVATPPTFPSWYERARAAASPAGEPITWKGYCHSLDETGVVYHDAVLVLRGYGRAIESLSEGKDFDGSGLENAGSGASSVAGALHASSVASAAQSAGSAASTAAGVIVGFTRARELNHLLSRGAPAAKDVVGSLRAYLAALESERKLVAFHRDAVLKATDARRDSNGAFTAAAEATIAFDLARDGATRLLRLEQQIAADDALLAKMSDALVALGQSAGKLEPSGAEKKAAEVLSHAIEEQERMRPENP